MRLFIGYFLPKRIAEYVHSIENELFGMNIKGSFTKQENLHLTFKFLGETDEATAEDTKGILSRYSKLDLRFSLDRLSWFEKRGSSVLYVDLVGDVVQLEGLVDELNEDLRAAGFEKDPRRFKAHVTIARKIRLDRISREKINGIRIEPMEFKVEAFNLINSTLTRTGPVYEIIG
ncbi:MAG: RNA 2',3'-cyclic phosphodiesterase [Peptoclostridium sp.]|uniref:RNA 2',3'-cyclic phosphodiesterase n=1 Tax=Peptoclostridium sp. TaxID=1904860 RepID=UPI00139D21E5|nr:RNA 2',3'-cyclic phosphodiesterase [Peptoclostridium sp.]MZQ76116.1 RNA 2',3'-cyclic phosphodiesterase [Peptoclostridium sp.]